MKGYCRRGNVGIGALLALLLLVTGAKSEDATMLVDGRLMHQMQPGEALSGLAKRYLGGEENVPELLEFNNIRNPTSVRAGTWIAIPGAIRDVAVDSIIQAEAGLKAAGDAQAEKFAKPFYAGAMEKLKASRQARFSAAYAKAIGLAEVSVALSRQAIAEANKNANVSRDGRFMKVHGDVDVSIDNGATWNPVKAGDQMPVSALVRTGPESRAEFSLEDGSELQISESTEVNIAQFIEDLRTGVMNVELEVTVGNLLGRIKPRNDGSKRKVKTPRASIAIRGTTLRVRTKEDRTVFGELIEGRADMISDRGTQQIPPAYGTVMPPDGPPRPPIPLLASPAVRAPASGLETARQLVSLAWDPAPGPKPTRYQVEIADDDRFTRIRENRYTEGQDMVTAVLPQGDYFWRVTAIDKNGLVGMPGETRPLSIRKHMLADLLYLGAIKSLAGEKVIGPDIHFRAVPLRKDTSVVRLEYRIDDGPFQPHDQPFNIAQDGVHRITVRGIAADGDIGPEKQLSVRVDVIPPSITMAVSAPFRNADGTHSIEATLSARDNVKLDRIEYAVDRGPYKPYAEPITLSAYKSYKVRYRAVDFVGNVSPEFETRVTGEYVPRGELPMRPGLGGS